MAGYMEYKDSGVSWIGEIPAHWETRRIKSLATEKNAAFLDGDWINAPDIAEEGIRYLTTGNIGQGVFKEQGKGYISEETFQRLNCLEVHGGDLVISRLNEPVGRACIIPEKYMRCIVAVDNVVLRPNSNLDKKYLMYAMSSDKYAEYALLLARGTTMQRISRTQLGTIPLPTPPIDEQNAIAKYLDGKIVHIDSVIAEAKASIEEYKAWKVSIVYEAVTKGLNPKAALKDSGFEWIGLIPSHWKLAPNKRVMHKEKRICEEYAGQDIISLTMNGVIVRDLGAGGKMPTSFDGYQYVYPGELLMCLFDIDVTPRCVGRVYNEGLTSPAYSSFVLHDGANLDYYYYYYLMMDNTKELLHLSKNLRHSLTEEQLGQIKVPVPPMDEQIEIGRVLDRKASQIDALIAEKEALIKELDAYKKSLIFEVVTGKRKVV